MGTADRVVYGSDDDLEDDISHEYQESLPTSRSTSASAAAAPRELLDTSGEQVADAMHEAHAGLFDETPSINITDQTDPIDFNNMTAATSMKRNRTTMEQLSSKQTTYSSKASLVRRFDPEDAEMDMPAPKKVRRAKSTQLPSQHSPRKVSQSKRSGSTNFEMPSSHETHAAGSKDLQFASPEPFRTQTTIPFTGATQSAMPPTQAISPMVVIPQMSVHDTGYGAQGEPVAPHPGSSAVLEETIDGIDTWLVNDIAQGRAEQEQAQRNAAQEPMALPDTDPASLRPPEFKNHTEDDSQGSINPQDLMLDQTNLNPISSLKSSQDPLGYHDLGLETSQKGAKKSRRKSTIDRRSEHDPDRDFESKRTKTKSSQVDKDNLGDLDADLPPPEMYKPRPSKSRGRRATADPSALESPAEPVAEPKKPRNNKRRKTAGDASTPIEILDDDDEPPRPAKRAKTNSASNKPEQEKPEQGNDTIMPDAVVEDTARAANGAVKSAGEAVQMQRQGTVEPGDMIDEVQAESVTTAPAKKKRGRPRKQTKENGDRSAEAEQKKSESSSQAKAQTSSLKCEGPIKGEEPVVPELGDSIDDEPVTAPKRRQSRNAARLADSEDESEDELAGKAQRKKSASKAVAKDVEVVEDAAAESVEVAVKQPAKRGRKPRANAATAAAIYEEQPEDAAETVLSAHEEEAAPEPSRSPLKEKANAQNQNLQVVVPGRDRDLETPQRSASPEKTSAPETPQVQQKSGIAAKPSPLTTGKVKYRVGLSRRMRIEPLLKTLKR